jgi:hypothetical protein
MKVAMTRSKTLNSENDNKLRVKMPIAESKQLTDDDCTWLVVMDKQQLCSQNLLTKLYTITRNRLQQWRKNIDAGKPVRGKPGNKCKINETDAQRIREAVRTNYESNAPLSEDAVVDMILDAITDNYCLNHPTASRAEALANTKLCDATEKKIMTAIDGTLRKSQSSTKARKDACECVRHVFSLAVALCAFAKYSPGNKKVNADATTMIINMEKVRVGGGELVMIPISNKEGDKMKGKAQQYEGSEMSTIVKVVHISAANGMTAGESLIVVDKNIPDGEFRYYKLKNFGAAANKTASGVYLCNTRAGNDALWQDWYVNQVIPFCNAMHEVSVGSDRDLPVFFSTDGEGIIMKQALSDSIHSQLNAANIVYARIPAGTTGILQPCDRARFFATLKQRMKSSASHRKYRNPKTVNTDLKKEIDRVIDYDEMKVPMKRKLSEVLLLCDKLICDALDKDDVIRSFVICGHHKDTDTPDEPTVDFRAVMNQSYQNIADADMVHMEAQLPRCIEVMKSTGRLPWSLMDELNIAMNQHGIKREDLTIVRHSCEIITSPEMRDWYKTWTTNHDPEYQRVVRTMEAADLEIRKQQEEQRIAAERKQAKEQKDAEAAALKAAKQAAPRVRRTKQQIADDKARQAEQKAIDDAAKEDAKAVKAAEKQSKKRASDQLEHDKQESKRVKNTNSVNDAIARGIPVPLMLLQWHQSQNMRDD